MKSKKYETPIGTIHLRYKSKKDRWAAILRHNGKIIYRVNYYDKLGNVIEAMQEYINSCIVSKDYTLLSDPFEMASLFGGRVFGRPPKLPPPNTKQMH